MKIPNISHIISLVLFSTLITACGGGGSSDFVEVIEEQGDTPTVPSDTDPGEVLEEPDNIPTVPSDTPQELSPEEIQGLLFMREEEELARDLYLDIYAAKDSRLKIFKNISDNAETQHAAAMLVLLENYGIDDPSTGQHNTYTSGELQALYDQLLSDALGSDDLAALRVGALVEETDIQDINTEIALVSEEHQDIITTYENLLCGSRNHLRSFAKQISNITGQDYITQVPSMDTEVGAILSSEQEQCGQ